MSKKEWTDIGERSGWLKQAQIDISKFDYLTIQPSTHSWDLNKYAVYGHGTYEESSVLHGKPKRSYLDSFMTGQYYIPKSDIESNISYEKITDTTFKLCADFKVSNLDEQDDRYDYLGGWQHQTGYICFEKTAESMAEKPMPLRID